MKNHFTYHIKTLGCQMNKSDSQRVRSIMDNAGFELVDEKDKANILIVVACSVRQSAIDRIWGTINKQKTINKEQSKQLQIITGCLLPSEKQQFSNKVDLIIDIKNIQKLPTLINEKINQITRYQDNNLSKQAGKVVGQLSNRAIEQPASPSQGGSSNASYFHIQPTYSSPFTAHVPIMTGCNNYCSYCVVPYTRGSEYSRPVEEILDEVNNLVVQGYKEIILLGQNVNSYKSKLNNRAIEQLNNEIMAQLFNCSIVNFPTLLRIINSIKGNFWIRFVTSHPKDLSDELIQAMVECDKVTEYLHLPAQSGDNEVLEKMNRKYTIEHYKKLINKIRSAYSKENIIPSISTDLIVGFPGETEKQFNKTAQLMQEIKYDMAYVAQYSPRPGTAAAKLDDDVPKTEKKRRKKVLTAILKKTALENNQKLIGQDVDVLVENCKNKICMGKTRTFKNVKFDGDSNLLGKFVKLKIKKADAWGLRAVKQQYFIPSWREKKVGLRT